MKRGVGILLLLVGSVAGAAAQTLTVQADRVVASDRVVIGGTQWGTKSPLRVVGLPSATSETTCLLVDGDGYVVAGSCSGVGGGGTVTSVGLAMPAQFTVTGSPVTTAGTLTASWNAQAATYVLAGPTSGSPAAPTFRALTDDDIPNNLTLGLVSGTPTFLGVTSFDSTIKSSSWMSGLAGWGITAAGTADFRYLTSDELHVKVFVADLQRALAGGQVVSKSVAVVAQELTLPVVGQSVTLWVYDLPGQPDTPVFEANDWVLLQVRERMAGGLLSVEAWGVVTNYQDQTDGRQTWTWTRQNVGSGWTGPVRQDSLAVDYGKSGDGFVWSSALGEFAPFVSVNTWSGTPTTVTTRARVGRLTGITGVTTEYGGLFGDYAGRQYFRASNTDVSLHGVNFTMYEGTTPVIAFDRTAPSFALGNPLPTGYGVGTGIWMGKDGSAYKLRIGDPGGNRVTWDGSSLSVVGTLTSTSGTIGGWTLGTTTLTGTNVLLDATGTIRAGAGGGARVELTNAPALRWYSASNTLLGAIDSSGMVVNASNVDNNQPEASYRFGNLPGDASMWVSGARYTYDTIPVQAMWLVSNVQTTDDTRRGWIRLLSQPADAGGDHAAILEVVGAADNGSTGIPDNPNFQGLGGNPQTKSLIWARLFGGGTFLVDGNMVVNGQVLVPGGFTISGTVELAQALAQNGTNCAAGEAARGIDQYGNAEGCWAPTTGTVTSVGLSLPSSVFSVSGSPVTTSGTLTGTFVTQSANTVFAGPSSGGAAVPTFRALGKADLPGSVAYRDEANAFTAGVTITSATPPQLSVRADANNRLDVSVSGSGAVTLDAVGAGAAITLPDAVTASSTLAVTGAVTANSTLTVAGAATFNGNVTLGDATSDTVTVTARLASGLTWSADNTYDIGASGGNRPRDVFIARNTVSGGTFEVPGALYASASLSAVGIRTTSPSFALDVNANVIAVGTKTAQAGLGGNIRYRDDSGTVRWLSGLLGTAGAQDWTLYDVVTGQLRLSVVPRGEWIFGHAISGVEVPPVLRPARNYVGSLGTPAARWLSVHAAELNVETLVAREVTATSGGRILVGRTSLVDEPGALSAGATSMVVRHNVFSNGDVVVAEGDGQIEYMRITGGPIMTNHWQSASWEDGTVPACWTTCTNEVGQGYWGNRAIRVPGAAGGNAMYRTDRNFDGNAPYLHCAYIRRADGQPYQIGDASIYIFPSYYDGQIVERLRDQWVRVCAQATTGASPNYGPHLRNNLATVDLYVDGTTADAWQTELSPYSETRAIYTITRNLDGSGANTWPRGTALFSTGSTGAGWMDLYADTSLSGGATGPTIVGNIRQSTTWNDWGPRWAIGNLQGVYGYTTATYGAAFGVPDGTHLTIDPTNGIRMRNGTTTTASWQGTTIQLGQQTLSADGDGRVTITPTQFHVEHRSGGVNRSMLYIATSQTTGYSTAFVSSFELRPATGTTPIFRRSGDGDMRIEVSGYTSRIMFIPGPLGDVGPVTDNYFPLGSSSYRWKNIHLALQPASSPNYVVTGASAGSSDLGYLAGFTGTKTAGACVMTFQTGVLVSVTGC